MNHPPFRKIHYLILFSLLTAAILFSFREALGQRGGRGGGGRGGSPSYGYPSYGYPSYGYYSAPAPAQSAPTPTRSAPTPTRSAPTPTRSAPSPRQEAPPAQREAPRPSRPQPQAQPSGREITPQQGKEITQKANEVRQALGNIQNQTIRNEVERLILQSTGRGSFKESVAKLADIKIEIDTVQIKETLQQISNSGIKAQLQKQLEAVRLGNVDLPNKIEEVRNKVDIQGLQEKVQDFKSSPAAQQLQSQLQQIQSQIQQGVPPKQVFERIEEVRDRVQSEGIRDALQQPHAFQERLAKIRNLLNQLKAKKNLCKRNPDLPQCKECTDGIVDIQECSLSQPEIKYTCPGIHTRVCTNRKWGPLGLCEYAGEKCQPYGREAQ